MCYDPLRFSLRSLVCGGAPPCRSRLKPISGFGRLRAVLSLFPKGWNFLQVVGCAASSRSPETPSWGTGGLHLFCQIPPKRGNCAAGLAVLLAGFGWLPLRRLALAALLLPGGDSGWLCSGSCFVGLVADRFLAYSFGRLLLLAFLAACSLLALPAANGACWVGLLASRFLPWCLPGCLALTASCLLPFVPPVAW